MWRKLANFVLRYKLVLLVCLFMATVLMGYFASKVKLSYEFAKAIPIDNPIYNFIFTKIIFLLKKNLATTETCLW